jgi:MFS family permease
VSTGARARSKRTLWIIAAGRGISFLGDEFAMLALAFRAKDQLGHFGVAAVLLAGTVPMILGAPWAGLLVDRIRTRPILLYALACQVVICLALATVNGWVDLALIAALSAGAVVAGPAWSALVPSIVTDEELPGAMGLIQSFQTLAGILGPILGGLAVAGLGLTWPFTFDALSFAVLFLVVIALRLDRRPEGAGTPRVRGEAFAGVLLIWKHPLIRSVVVLFGAFIVAIGAINVVEIFFVTEVLHASAAGYGLLGACFGAGALATSVTAEFQTKRLARLEVLLILGCVAIALGLLGIGLAPTLLVASVGAVLAGAGNGMVNVHGIVILLRKADPLVQGRVLAAVQGVLGVASILGLGLGGILASAFHPRSVIIGASIASLGTLLVTMWPMIASSSDEEGTPA